MNDELIERILTADRVWAAYALADLQPDLAAFCRWFPVRSEGVVLLFDGLSPAVLFAMGTAEVVGEALIGVSLPDQISLHVREEHLPLLETQYDFGIDLRPMLRLSLVDSRIVKQRECFATTRLRSDDVSRIRSLYRNGGEFTPDYFADSQIDHGIFLGVEENGELVAVGGTHVLDSVRGIAAIGNMYTHPDLRGKGCATSILSALLRDFLRLGIKTVVMNVDQRNTTARRLYERLGFKVHCSYLEGNGRLHEWPMSTHTPHR